VGGRPGRGGLDTGPGRAGRRWFQFARDEVGAAELIARLLAGHEVADLTLEEPDIEDIVHRICRGESPP
jgi:hypothetical protein